MSLRTGTQGAISEDHNTQTFSVLIKKGVADETTIAILSRTSQGREKLAAWIDHVQSNHADTVEATEQQGLTESMPSHQKPLSAFDDITIEEMEALARIFAGVVVILFFVIWWVFS